MKTGTESSEERALGKQPAHEVGDAERHPERVGGAGGANAASIDMSRTRPSTRETIVMLLNESSPEHAGGLHGRRFYLRRRSRGRTV
ncbi:hypothetical protein [Rhodanobacter lindaniclasticus]